MGLGGLAVRTLVLLGLVTALENPTFPYNYTYQAADSGLAIPSVFNDSSGVKHSSWDNIDGQLTCNRGTNCSNTFVYFPLMGSGFCLYGKLNPTVYVYFYNRTIGSRYYETTPVVVSTDGSSACLNSASPDWNTTSDAFILSGAASIDRVETDASTNLPEGWSKAHYSTTNHPFVVNNALDTNSSLFTFSVIEAPQLIQGADGTPGIFLPNYGAVQITVPPNCGMVVLNGYVGQDLGFIRTSGQKPLPFPVPITGTDRAVARSDAASPILVTPVYPSQSSWYLSFECATVSQQIGVNITSVDFYIFERDDDPKAQTSSSSWRTSSTGISGGSPTGSSTGSSENDGRKKSNVGAIAGGVVGGVVALILLAILLWFLMCRQKPRNRSTSARDPSDENDKFVIDESVTTTPFVSVVGSASGQAVSTNSARPGQFVTHSSSGNQSFDQPRTYPISKQAEAMAAAHGGELYQKQVNPSLLSPSSPPIMYPFPPPSQSGGSTASGPSQEVRYQLSPGQEVKYKLSPSGELLPVTPGFATHEEDAGHLSGKLPPMYNNEWDRSSPPIREPTL